ncbi:MAG: DeoR/GlpR family DNA-binding transcription regulator [Breznakia sp.]
MLSRERKFRIVKIVNEKTFVTIAELMETLQASKSSINRDLIDLEKESLLQRTRGGATLKDPMRLVSTWNEKPVFDKENMNVKAKQVICDYAAQNIKDGDCIFIDSGTTPTYLLTHFANKKIQIVTTSVYVIRKLPAAFKGDIYLLGGEFRRKYDMSLGPITIESIKQFNFDHAFLSCNGVDLEKEEVYTVDFAVGAVKKEIMKRSRNKYVLVDDAKFGIKAVCTWAKLQDFTKMYVNDFPKQEEHPDNLVVCKKKSINKKTLWCFYGKKHKGDVCM